MAVANERTAAEIPLPLQPDQPATPQGLLSLSQTLEGMGYVKLARYLRSAADGLSARTSRVPVAVLNASQYARLTEPFIQGESRYIVAMTGEADAVHAVRLGKRYALVEVDPPRDGAAP